MPTIDVAATGDNIRSMCISAGVTPKDMQDACGLTTRNAVYKWLNGTAVPNIDNLVIAKEFPPCGYECFRICMQFIHVVRENQDSEGHQEHFLVASCKIPQEIIRLFLCLPKILGNEIHGIPVFGCGLLGLLHAGIDVEHLVLHQLSIIIGVLGLIGTFFSIGYQIGKDSRQNKKDDETQK